MKITEQFLDKTIQVWQPLYEQTLTRKDARQIIENVYAFFDLTSSWDAEQGEGNQNVKC
jgi:hypothetical protein